jgi:hypothetical protein
LKAWGSGDEAALARLTEHVYPELLLMARRYMKDEAQGNTLGRLIEKIRRGLSRRHLRKEKYGIQIADRIVCGKIAWDDAQDGSVPLLHIDGREITWEEFGRMLMSFEGWQFKLEIRDKSEEF